MLLKKHLDMAIDLGRESCVFDAREFPGQPLSEDFLWETYHEFVVGALEDEFPELEEESLDDNEECFAAFLAGYAEMQSETHKRILPMERSQTLDRPLDEDTARAINKLLFFSQHYEVLLAAYNPRHFTNLRWPDGQMTFISLLNLTVDGEDCCLRFALADRSTVHAKFSREYEDVFDVSFPLFSTGAEWKVLDTLLERHGLVPNYKNLVDDIPEQSCEDLERIYGFSDDEDDDEDELP
jgi:hypothetical protein